MDCLPSRGRPWAAANGPCVAAQRSWGPELPKKLLEGPQAPESRNKLVVRVVM